jgi:hypothetical protein
MASISLRERAKRPAAVAQAKPAVQLKHAQGVVYADRTRFRILTAGRRFGKTFLAILELMRGATEKKGNYAYCAPTYKMAKDIAWKQLKETVPQQWIKRKNESDLSVELLNGSLIALKGTEYAAALRGQTWDGIVLDESAFMGDDVWGPVLRPTLASTRGWALFITTPSPGGTAGWFYELVMQVTKPHVADPNLPPIDRTQWSYHSFTTLQGENVPEEEIVAARAELDPRTFAIEYEASFEALGSLVAIAFDDENIRMVEDDPKLPLLIGADFNVSPLTTVIGVIKGNELHIFDELVLTGGSTTWDLADALHARFGLDREKHCCPDPTGARQQTSGVGMSDHAILRRAGIRVFASKGWNTTKDKINATNAALMTADGVRHCFIHPRCRNLIKSFRTLGYAPNTDVPNKKLGVDHAFDAFSYLVLEKFNLNKAKQGGTSFRVW